MIDLDSKRKLSYYSDFKTGSLIVFELMEGIFGSPLVNPVNIKDSPLVRCILSGVNVKPTGVLKLFCYHPNLT